MEQHPIPQNVSSYQFKLVGDMTLKQFFQLAGGLVVGFIIYSSGLLAIIRWPLSLISAITGIALAFVPFEGRPLEKWVVAFFRAIYRPTQFSWNKSASSQVFYQNETAQAEVPPANDYYSQTPQAGGVSAKLEAVEKGFLTKLTQTFGGLASNLIPKPQNVPVIPITPVAMPPIPSQHPVTPSIEVPKVVDVPMTPLVSVTSSAPKLNVEEVIQPTVTVSPTAPIAPQATAVSAAASFSHEAAPPSPPTVANTITGQVINENREIVEGAILEVRDAANRPVRALKSNKLGHFIIVTPLANGRYEMIIDKEGYEFMPIHFEASGLIIPPILVQGRRVTEAGSMNQEVGGIQQGYGTTQQN